MGTHNIERRLTSDLELESLYLFESLFHTCIIWCPVDIRHAEQLVERMISIEQILVVDF